MEAEEREGGKRWGDMERRPWWCADEVVDTVEEDVEAKAASEEEEEKEDKGRTTTCPLSVPIHKLQALFLSPSPALPGAIKAQFGDGRPCFKVDQQSAEVNTGEEGKDERIMRSSYQLKISTTTEFFVKGEE